MEQKIQKKSFLFEIMAFEVVARNSAYCNQNTCYRQMKVLTKSLKISDQTIADFFQFNIYVIYGKIG